MPTVYVHPYVLNRHPEIGEDNIIHAFLNYEMLIPRLDVEGFEYVGFGFDKHGRAIEFVVRRNEENEWLIFHANTPLSNSIKKELGLERKKNER